MLALVRDGRNDPPVTLQEVPEPQPKEGEALVQVRASTVNRGELALLADRRRERRGGRRWERLGANGVADQHGETQRQRRAPATCDRRKQRDHPAPE